jgi:hypothetical protein
MNKRQVERLKRLIGRRVRVSLRDSGTDVEGALSGVHDRWISLIVHVHINNILQVGFEETISSVRREPKHE